jgi:hypothetical protein
MLSVVNTLFGGFGAALEDLPRRRHSFRRDFRVSGTTVLGFYSRPVAVAPEHSDSADLVGDIVTSI